MQPRNGEGDVTEGQQTPLSKERLHRGGPEQNHDGQVDEGAPCLEDFATGVLDALLSLNLFQGGSGGLTEDVLGLPLLHDECQSNQSQQRRDDVDELGVTEACEQDRLAARVNQTNNQCYQTDFADTAQTVLNSNKQYGDESRHDLDNQDHFDGQCMQVHAAAGCCGGHGDTDSAVCTGAHVSNQCEHCGLERVETQGHEQCSTDSNRDTEACSAFKEAAEAECDQQHLDALVGRDGGDGGANNFEAAGTHRNAVEPHCHEHDPADGPHAREEAVEDGSCTGSDGHAEDSATDDQCNDEGDNGRFNTAELQDGEAQKEENNRDCCHECGECARVQRVVDLLPHDVLCSFPRPGAGLCRAAKPSQRRVWRRVCRVLQVRTPSCLMR